MLSVLVVAMVVAVLVALGLVLGGAFLAALLVLAGIAVAVWIVRALARRRHPKTSVQGERTAEAENPELLGPGGPDDPRS
jgi:membrane protein implicated in regulation of membrane protease activity